MVIQLASLRVTQDLVCFVDLLEFLFRARVGAVYVGVVLAGETAICFLDLVRRRASSYAQYLVVIMFAGHPAAVRLVIAN